MEAARRQLKSQIERNFIGSEIGETFNPYLTTRFYIEHILSILHKFFVEIDTCLILSILLHRSLLRLDESR